MDWARILEGYLAILNLASFAIMAIPEKTLLVLAAAGGSPGVWLGMYVFHHKTKKRKFTLGVPVILCLQGLALLLLVKGL